MTDAILRLPAVVKMSGLSRPTIYRRMNDGSFPRAVHLSERSRGWRESEVQQWIRSLRTECASPETPGGILGASTPSTTQAFQSSAAK